MNGLVQYWEQIRSSLWFVPSMIVLGMMALAVGLIAIDTNINAELLARWPRLFGASAEGSRAMLSSIAGSMITIAGVTFSITIVALAQASSQYTPRILRTFMRDRSNQVVLGVFIGIFAYCLVVLRTIRTVEESLFVPSLSVVFGIVLALVGVGFLIFFIHHIARSLQVSSILAAVAKDTLETIDRLFPEPVGEEPDEEEDVGTSLEGIVWHPVSSTETGYLQRVDGDGLVGFAAGRDLVVRVEFEVGDFVVEGAPIASVSRRLDDEEIGRLNGRFSIGRYRTITQDADFGVQQIVDIAVKALSPGINDPTTANNCLDHLSSILSRLAERHVATPYRYRDGQLRVIATGSTFRALVEKAFSPIRPFAKGNVTVMVRMLEAIETIVGFTRGSTRMRVLLEHARLIARAAHEIEPDRDREPIVEIVSRLERLFEERSRGHLTTVHAHRAGMND